MWTKKLWNIKAGFTKGTGNREPIANTHRIIENTREFQKNICFIDYSKGFDSVHHDQLWKILKEMGVSDHLTRLIRNLYADQEATVRIGYGAMGWFKIGKGVHQGCILGLFNLYAEYITQNAGLDEAQAGIKIAGEISITSTMQMTPALWQKAKKN